MFKIQHASIYILNDGSAGLHLELIPECWDVILAKYKLSHIFDKVFVLIKVEIAATWFG